MLLSIDVDGATQQNFAVGVGTHVLARASDTTYTLNHPYSLLKYESGGRV